VTSVAAGSVRRRVIAIVVAAAAGALFGAGLLVSGMTQPAKVIGFLDVTHGWHGWHGWRGSPGWDPSLAFVMGGAAAVYALAYRRIRRGPAPRFADRLHLPTRRYIDVPLVAGAALFGVGWGLGGLCPGPALVAAAAGSTTGLAFVAAMLVGMLVQRAPARDRSRRTGSP